MKFTSYAQNFEDVMLWRALRHVKAGCYVDIGANDPVADSVSRAFYDQGWRGVHLEPSAQYAALLRQDRPDELVIQAAVGQNQTLLTFYEFPDTGLSTLSKTIADEHQARGFKLVQNVTPTLTLDDVFSQLSTKDVHWLKIDVEGAEQDVLLGWRTSPVRPWIIVVESTLPMSQVPSHQHWEPLVLAKGYQCVYFDGLNRYYVSDLHPELSAEPWLPPNVFDGFCVDGRASNVLCQDLQHRLDVAEERGQQSATAALQEYEQTKQTLLNQLAQTRAQLELDATAAREEYQLLSDQMREARDELGLMVRLVSQREQEFAERFEHFQTDYKSVSSLLQQEREQSGIQLQALHQQLIAQQQQYQVELQRHSELDQQLNDLQQQLRQKEQAFAKQLLQQQQQKSDQYKVFQIREQSLRTELQRAREEIQRIGTQYQTELAEMRQDLFIEQENKELELAQKFNDQLNDLHLHIHQKERAFADQLLQLHKEKTDLRKVFEISQESVKAEYAKAKVEIENLREKYKKEVHSLKFINENLIKETTYWRLKSYKLQQIYSEQVKCLELKFCYLSEQLDAATKDKQQYEAVVENFILGENEINKINKISEKNISKDVVKFENYIYDLVAKLKREENKKNIDLHYRYEQQLLEAKNSLIFFESKLKENDKVLIDITKDKDIALQKLSLVESCNEKYKKDVELLELKHISLQQSVHDFQERLNAEVELNKELNLQIDEANRNALNDICFIKREIELIYFDSKYSVSRFASDFIERIYSYVSDKYESNKSVTTDERIYMKTFDDVFKVKHISELLNFDGEFFVNMVFYNILDRTPDAIGFCYYSSQIKAGKSKIEIIYQIANSLESRDCKKGIDGLEILLSKCKKAKIPFIGKYLQPKIYREISSEHDYVRSAIIKITTLEEKFTSDLENISNKISVLEERSELTHQLVLNLEKNIANNIVLSVEPVHQEQDTKTTESVNSMNGFTRTGIKLFEKVFGEIN